MVGTRAQVGAVAAALAVTLALAAVALTRRGGQRGAPEALLQVGAGDGTFSDDSLRLKRQRMVAELKGLRGVEGGMREQLAKLNQQEHALQDAWQSTEVAADGGSRGRHGRETREALSSSIFSPAFPGAQSSARTRARRTRCAAASTRTTASTRRQ